MSYSETDLMKTNTSTNNDVITAYNIICLKFDCNWLFFHKLKFMLQIALLRIRMTYIYTKLNREFIH